MYGLQQISGLITWASAFSLLGFPPLSYFYLKWFGVMAGFALAIMVHAMTVWFA